MTGQLLGDQPREKLKAKGPSALSDDELLRTLIGSGNAQASAARIAKRTLKLLQQHGSSVTYEQLQAVSGLGSARISSILAGFELASRYPVPDRRVRFSPTQQLQLLLGADYNKGIVYITLDGARRVIMRRTMRLGRHSSDEVVRKLCTAVLQDHAAEVIVGRFHNDRLLVPAMLDLQLARALKQSARLFGIARLDYILFNTADQHSIVRDA